jgi:hypothetical protein
MGHSVSHKSAGELYTEKERVERLMRWYPPAWRHRYGPEFSELLISELTEMPNSWRRTVNVVWSAILTRFAFAGISKGARRFELAPQAALASFGGASAVFVVFGAAIWAQLTIGWQWSAPPDIGTSFAMVLMSAMAAATSVLLLLGSAPIAYSVVTQITRRRTANLIVPASLFTSGAVLLLLGTRHFGNGWPGTGAHHWAHQGLVPGGVAAFSWAATLSVSSYWAHPSALGRFPIAELAWMGLSPLAFVVMIVGGTKTMRRLDLSRRVLRFEASLGRMTSIAMVLFLAACACWLVDGGPGPHNLFRSGYIDVLGAVIMGASLGVADRSIRNARIPAPLASEY